MDGSPKTLSVHDELARRVHSVRFNDIPNEVVEFAKTLVLDSIGCLIGGIESSPAQAARRLAGFLGGNSQATVFGTRQKTSMSLAALTNGTALRYLDFNDSYSSHNTAHPSGNLPSALSVAEVMGRSGRDLITALVAAYEVHLRLCDLAGDKTLKQRGWHNTTNLQFASAAAAARLLTEDPSTTAQAMAISGTHQNTLAQIQHGGIAMIKATADGWVGKGAVEAACLAREGLTGPDQIFEGKAGWTRTVAGMMDHDRLLAPFGPDFGMTKVRLKPFAAVGSSMAVVQAAVDIFQSHRASMNAVKQILVRIPERVLENPATGEERRFPKNRESADHSFHYCAVIALLEGNCSEDQYASSKLSSPVVRELLTKVSIEADREFSTLGKSASGGGLKVIFNDGTETESRYLYPPGDPLNPLSGEQLDRKFDALAAPHFSSARREAIKKAVRNLEDLDNVAELCNLLAKENDDETR